MPQATSEDGIISRPTQEQIDDESRRIRRLRILVQLTIESIAAGDLTPEEAAGMVAWRSKCFRGKSGRSICFTGRSFSA
jgi:hypothetical protein